MPAFGIRMELHRHFRFDQSCLIAQGIPHAVDIIVLVLEEKSGWRARTNVLRDIWVQFKSSAFERRCPG